MLRDGGLGGGGEETAVPGALPAKVVAEKVQVVSEDVQALASVAALLLAALTLLVRVSTAIRLLARIRDE